MLLHSCDLWYLPGMVDTIIIRIGLVSCSMRMLKNKRAWGIASGFRFATMDPVATIARVCERL